MILNGVIKAIDAKSQAKERGDASKDHFVSSELVRGDDGKNEIRTKKRSKDD